MNSEQLCPARIFLDLDDVLNQFTLYALQRVGCPIGSFDYHRFKPAWGWDIVTAANNLHPTKAFTEESFWNSIDRDVWATVPMSLEAFDLIAECASLVGRSNVYILSSPTLDPESLAGKLKWIQSYLPKWMHRQFLFGPRKFVCANPGAVLIDDRGDNIQQWRQEGGIGILMPRPWNSLYEATCSGHGYVRGQLRLIFSGEIWL